MDLKISQLTRTTNYNSNSVIPISIGSKTYGIEVGVLLNLLSNDVLPSGNPDDILIINTDGNPEFLPAEDVFQTFALYEPWVDTISEIRAFTIHENNNIKACINNGILYQYSSSSTAADDGVDVLKPNDVSGSGRWINVYEFASQTDIDNINNDIIDIVTDVSNIQVDVTNIINGTLSVRGEVPIGGCILWTNFMGQLPPNNWVFCDGTNGTVDMRGYLIAQGFTMSDVGLVSGVTDVTLATNNLPSHNHTLSGSIYGTTDLGGIHQHRVDIDDVATRHYHTATSSFDFAEIADPINSQALNLVAGNRIDFSGTTTPTVTVSQGIWNVGVNKYSTTVDDSGGSASHIHSFTAAHTLAIGNTGSALSFSVAPPRYKVAIIMRIA